MTLRPDENDASRPWRAEDLLRVIAEQGEGSPAWRALPPGEVVPRYLDALEERTRSGITTIAGQLAEDARLRGLLDPDTPPAAVPNHRLVRRIGFGGSGEVWLARHTLTEHDRACKLVPAHHTYEIEGLRWLKQRVPSHPNLFPIEEVGAVEGWVYCLMPLADDAAEDEQGADYVPLTLHELLKRRWRLPGVEAAEIAGELAEGLRHLHDRGLTHGDIKPGNILRLGGRWTLADYGLLREDSDARPAGHTPSYAPPEGPGTQAADIYALGVVFMGLLTGRGPRSLADFRNRPRTSLWREKIDPAWHRLVVSMTAARASDRPRIDGVAAALDRLDAEALRRRKHRRFVGSLHAGVALVAVASGAVVVHDLRETKQRELVDEFIRGSQSEVQRWLLSGSTIVQDDRAVRLGGIHDIPEGSVRSHSIAINHWSGIAISETGELVAWGSNHNGICDIPAGIVNPVKVELGYHYALALQADGRIVQWGFYYNRDRVLPENPHPGPFEDIAAFMSFSALARTAGGDFVEWGELGDGCLARAGGLLGDLTSPADIRRFKGGNAHWIAQYSDGTIRGFGCNSVLQFDFGDRSLQAIDFDAAESWSVVAWADGTLRSYGVATATHLAAPDVEGVIDVAAGTYCGIALAPTADGRAMTVDWGRLGVDRARPDRTETKVVGVVAGGDTVGVVHPDGSLTLWGDNEFGQCDPPAGLRIRVTDPDTDRNGRPDWQDRLRAQANGG